MKTLSIATLCGCMFLTLSSTARADAEGDIVTLIGVLDAGVCWDWDNDPEAPGCDPEFAGWFGESTDVFSNNGKKREDRGCSPMPQFPVEDPSCNFTNSKAEWRHDSLRTNLESAYRKFVQYKFDSANRHVCSFVDKVEVMFSDQKIDSAGRDALVPRAEQIARDIGIDCLDLDP